MKKDKNKTIRIDKLFSTLGILSRTQCKTEALHGKIEVNGSPCLLSDTKITRGIDEVRYKGELVDTREYVYYMLNKPSGVITANDDPHQKTVFDCIEDKRTDLFAVGRLDKDTTGIILITNDGDFNHRVLSPKKHVSKRYLATIDGTLTEADKKLLCEGIDIGDDKPTLPAKLEVLDDNLPQKVYLSIVEGRYHQVKRMFEAVGKPVLFLHRDMFGPLALDEKLLPGEYRELTSEELALFDIEK